MIPVHAWIILMASFSIAPGTAFLHLNWWVSASGGGTTNARVATTGHRIDDVDCLVRWSQLQSCLFMGKGDGKKKRKKKNGTTPSPAAPVPAPMRVTSDSNVPVRHQIRWARLNKEYRHQASAGFRQKRVVRTSYRRAWDEEEMELKAEERRRKGQVSRKRMVGWK